MFHVPVVLLTSFLPRVSGNSMSSLFKINHIEWVSSQDPLLPSKEFNLFKKPNVASINQMVLNKVRRLDSAIVIVESYDRV